MASFLPSSSLCLNACLRTTTAETYTRLPIDPSRPLTIRQEGRITGLLLVSGATAPDRCQCFWPPASGLYSPPRPCSRFQLFQHLGIAPNISPETREFSISGTSSSSLAAVSSWLSGDRPGYCDQPPTTLTTSARNETERAPSMLRSLIIESGVFILGRRSLLSFVFLLFILLRRSFVMVKKSVSKFL